LHHLEINNVSASYGTLPVLRDVSLNVNKGEIVCLVGPSGSGKSTLLRALMGLTKPTTGEILIGGDKVDYNNKKSVSMARDRMAIVFQQYNLFQNMNVLKNVTLAPVEIKKWPAKKVKEHARYLLDKVGLSEKHNAYPEELSGGQQQRVAIARALALKPEILLLDEVTSALDPELVNEVLDTIRGLAEDGMTMLIVSHEMAFVREISSKVVMMDEGQMVEVGPPDQLIDNPKSERAKEFFSKVLRH
jgi:polar amino acid transport system ATP-binding protein